MVTSTITKSYWPFMNLEVDAFTSHWDGMTDQQQVIFDRLFFCMWRAKEKKLPTDDGQLARYARVTAGRWHKNKDAVLAKFEVSDAWISHPLIVAAHKRVEEMRTRQKLNSLAKSLKNNKTTPAMGHPTYNHNHNNKKEEGRFARSLADGEHREAGSMPDLSGALPNLGEAIAAPKVPQSHLTEPAEPQKGDREREIVVGSELANSRLVQRGRP